MHFSVYDVFYSLCAIGYLNVMYVDYLYIIDLMNSRKIELIEKKGKRFCLYRVLEF
jgi:hypothetical protein